jgi:hypothetical protein
MTGTEAAVRRLSSAQVTALAAALGLDPLRGGPRCGRVMTAYSTAGAVAAGAIPGAESSCGRPAGHHGQHVSVASLARSATRRRQLRDERRNSQ